MKSRQRSIMQPTVYRFRRWSRNGYAVFGSLHRCVSIGTLTHGIADASLAKSKNKPARTASCMCRDERPEACDDPELYASPPPELVLWEIPVTKVPCHPRAGHDSYNKNILPVTPRPIDARPRGKNVLPYSLNEENECKRI